MTRYARMEGDIVAELIDSDDNPADRFHPALRWIEAEGEIAVGWRRAAAGFEPPPAPPAPPPPSLADLQAELAALTARIAALAANR